MKQTLNNGESYGSIRTKLNDMFTELYNSVTSALGNITQLASSISELAGTGRTTETVKGNADGISTLNTALLSHKDESATEEEAGHIEIATQAEVTTGTNDTKAVVPKYLKTELHKATNNRNILHNWDFRNPVNQRGQSSYSGTGIYTVDRWKTLSVNAFVTVGSTVSCGITGVSSSGNRTFIMQNIENYQQFKGKTVTATIDFKDGVYDSNTEFRLYIVDGVQSQYVAFNDTSGIKTITKTVSESATELSIRLNVNGFNASMTPIAIKLELGSVSTLANDPPADYGEQLALCKRFFHRIVANTLTARVISQGMGLDNGTAVTFPVPTSASMRIAPTVTISSYEHFLVTRFGLGSAGTPTGLRYVQSATEDGSILNMSVDYNSQNGEPYAIYLAAGGWIELSADL